VVLGGLCAAEDHVMNQKREVREPEWVEEERTGTVRKAGAQDIIDNELVLLRYHPKTKIVHHEFRRFVHGAPFREILDQGLAALSLGGGTRWLSDDRRNGPVTPADGVWALNDWAPRAIAAGWKYWGVVLPEKILGQMNLKRWMETYAKMGVNAQAFPHPEAAMSWLEKQ
jgi:hypothetical protein